jgi:uncharacterized protein (DUF433 family)
MNSIQSEPQIMGGTPCFAGTRVPIRNLFDYIEGSQTVDEFLADFPTVEREQVVAVLELGKVLCE